MNAPWRHTSRTSGSITSAGNGDLIAVPFDTVHLRKAAQAVARSLLVAPHWDVPPSMGTFDLVTCLNVIDNCEEPLALMERLQHHTAVGGLLAVSCTYQWSKRFLGTPEERDRQDPTPSAAPTKNLRTLFGGGWTLESETNLEYRLRKAERHWWLFLSHLVVFQKH